MPQIKKTLQCEFTFYEGWRIHTEFLKRLNKEKASMSTEVQIHKDIGHLLQVTMTMSFSFVTSWKPLKAT